MGMDYRFAVDSGPLLQKSREYVLALIWDLTAAAAKEYGPPDHAYPIGKYVAEQVSNPWIRMRDYLSPSVLTQIQSAFEDLENSPWRAVTEAEASHVTFRTLQRDITPTHVTMSVLGLRLKTSLVTPDGVRRVPQTLEMDLQARIDVVGGQITDMVVLPKASR